MRRALSIRLSIVLVACLSIFGLSCTGEAVVTAGGEPPSDAGGDIGVDSVHDATDAAPTDAVIRPPDTHFADADAGDTSDPDAGEASDAGDEDIGPQCGQDLTACGAACVDLTTSDEHCGGCNQPCGSPRSCQTSQCVCPQGEQWCSGECVDLSSNADHCGACGSPCEGGEVCADDQCHPNEKVSGVIEAVNIARSTDTDCGSYGVKSAVAAVTGDASLHEAAQRHADDMANNDFFSHTGSDGSSFSERISDTGYAGWPVGENIAANGTDPANIVDRWVASDGHCRNIMNGSGTKIGVGYSTATGNQWNTYWVMVLGS